MKSFITRAEHSRRKPYTIISNKLINDSRLSNDAKLTMLYILSKPNGWIVKNFDIERAGGFGKTVRERVLRELATYGYFYRTKARTSGGAFKWTQTIVEEPNLTSFAGNVNEPENANIASPATPCEQGHVDDDTPYIYAPAGAVLSTDLKEYTYTENIDTLVAPESETEAPQSNPKKTSTLRDCPPISKTVNKRATRQRVPSRVDKGFVPRPPRVPLDPDFSPSPETRAYLKQHCPDYRSILLFNAWKDSRISRGEVREDWDHDLRSYMSHCQANLNRQRLERDNNPNAAQRTLSMPNS